MRWSPAEQDFGNAELVAVTATPAGFVLVGNTEQPARGIVWTSSNGHHWAQVDESSAFDAATLDGVATVDGHTIIFGRDVDTGTIMVWDDADGTRWNMTTVDDDVTDGSRIRSMAATPAVLVAVGIDTSTRAGAVWTSLEGSTWQRQPLD